MSLKSLHSLILSLALPLALLQSGCYYDVESELYPMNFCDTAIVRYGMDIVPIVEAHCAIAGCHVPGGSGTGDFTSYAGLSSQVANGKLLPAVEQTGGASFMPPNGRLSDCDIAAFVKWVQDGAPQN